MRAHEDVGGRERRREGAERSILRRYVGARLREHPPEGLRVGFAVGTDSADEDVALRGDLHDDAVRQRREAPDGSDRRERIPRTRAADRRDEQSEHGAHGTENVARGRAVREQPELRPVETLRPGSAASGDLY
jgi:hypothetical protein